MLARGGWGARGLNVRDGRGVLQCHENNKKFDVLFFVISVMAF
jgi:hypothetical protein